MQLPLTDNNDLQTDGNNVTQQPLNETMDSNYGWDHVQDLLESDNSHEGISDRSGGRQGQHKKSQVNRSDRKSRQRIWAILQGTIPKTRPAFSIARPIEDSPAAEPENPRAPRKSASPRFQNCVWPRLRPKAKSGGRRPLEEEMRRCIQGLPKPK